MCKGRINRLKEEINQLEERLKLLNALEAAGVDNWEGYNAIGVWDD